MRGFRMQLCDSIQACVAWLREESMKLEEKHVSMLDWQIIPNISGYIVIHSFPLKKKEENGQE